MAHTRAGPFAANQKLTSALANTVDLNAATSCDTTASGDSLLGPITITGASGALTLAATAVNGLTIQAGSKIECSGALNVKTGSTCTIQSGGTLTSANGSAVTIAAGTTFATAAGMNCTSGTVTIAATAQLTCAANSTLLVSSQCTATINIGDGAQISVVGGTTGKIVLATSPTQLKITNAGTFTRSPYQHVYRGGVIVDLTKWGYATATLSITSLVAAAGLLTIAIQPHDGATLDSVAMKYSPAGGHGAIPAVLPTIAVFRQGLGGVIETLGATVSDVAGTVILYEQPRTLTFTGTTRNVIDTQNYSYHVQFNCEAGANSVLGLQVWGFVLNYSAIADMRFPS